MQRSSVPKDKAQENTSITAFVRQYFYLFLIDPIRLHFKNERYPDFEAIEKGYGKALLQAFHFALTTQPQELRLNHVLWQGIHQRAMSHMKEESSMYKVECNNFAVCFHKNVVNPAGTPLGFFEFIERGVLGQERSIYSVEFKPENDEQPAYLLYNTSDNKTVWHTVSKKEKTMVEYTDSRDQQERIVRLLADLTYKCYFNSGVEKLVAEGGYRDVHTATKEKLDEIFKSYNKKIFHASSPDEKLEIIVSHVQWLNQLHAFKDGNVRSCYALLNRLLRQHHLSPTILIDPNRFDCFDLEALINTVKDGQQAYQDVLQGKVPIYRDRICLERLGRRHPITSFEIPDAEKEVECFIQAITAPFESLHHRISLDIGPNETARLTVEEAKCMDILVRLQSDRLAIVFQDKKGNVSVTHRNQKTDSAFAIDEVSFMKDVYTIDVIRHGGSKNFEADVFRNEIFQALKVKEPIKNSKGNYDIRSTKTGNVLIQQGKLLVPENKNIEAILPTNVSAPVQADNPLKNAIISEGAVPSTMRQIKQLVAQLSYDKKLKPALVYHHGWTGSYSAIPWEATTFLEQAASQENLQGLEKLITSCARKTFNKNAVSDFSPNTQLLLRQMPSYLQVFWNCASRNLYSHLHSFFKSHGFAPKHVQLVTEYCESEAVTVHRALAREQKH